MGWPGRAQQPKTTVEPDGEASKLKELTMHTPVSYTHLRAHETPEHRNGLQRLRFRALAQFCLLPAVWPAATDRLPCVRNAVRTRFLILSALRNGPKSYAACWNRSPRRFDCRTCFAGNY